MNPHFVEILKAFRDEAVEYLVIGAHALAAHGHVRATLDAIPVGVAYAVWSGVGVTLVAAIGWLFLGQKLDAAAVGGMGLIVAGVVVLNLFSKSAAH